MNLPKVITNRKKRRGQGYGSGRGGHTSGRGQKGQKARGKMHILFEGVKVKKSFIKRLPLRRGKGKFKARKKPVAVNLAVLALLPQGAVINLKTLVEAGLVDKQDAHDYGAKILGNGEVTRKFTIEMPISKSAASKVEAAGGKIINESSEKLELKNTKQTKS